MITAAILMDAAERLAARPWFLIAFNCALVAMFVIAGLDAANLFISILTAELVLIGFGGARRSQLATQVKLDELISCTENARNELTRIEEQEEHVIQEKRL